MIKLEGGVLMTVLKLDGFSFETADQSELNVQLLARNDVLRTLGNSCFALRSHIIRREVSPSIPGSFDDPFCRELDERYGASLAGKRMFVNNIYLTLMRRNMQGHVGTFDVMMKRLMGKRDRRASPSTSARR